jgi:Dolichyl-phosphate-mannose-protein mannosyltransferase
MVKQQRCRDLLDLILILGAWGTAIALIQPHGNFPLNDDWDFALATWSFARTGTFHFTNFTAVSLRAQVLWGSVWTRLFGESFDVLRVSTLTLSALLITIAFLALRRAGAARGLRLAAALAFAFNPIFIWASCTYHTEVPYVCASAAALFLFFRALREDRLDLLVAGCAAVVISWFVRQTGVINALAPLVIVCTFRKRLLPRWKQFAATLAATLLLFMALLVFRREWLAGSMGEFANHFRMWTEVTFRLPEQIAMVDHYAVFNAQNAALFLLPLTLPLAITSFRRRVWEIVLLGVIALVVLTRVHGLVTTGHPMPYFSAPFCCDITAGNVLVNWGLGQQTLSDIWRLHQPYPLQLRGGARLLLTYGSAIVASVLIWRCILALLHDRRLLPQLAIGTALAGTLALFGSGIYVDRYAFDSAWSLGLAAPFLIDWHRRSARVLAVACLVALMIFDVAALQEYFAWSRARWAAFDALRVRGVPVQQIDGGTESFSFYEISKMTQPERRKNVIGFKPRPYVLTFRPVEDHVVVDRHPFRGWLIGRGTVYTLRAK